MLASGGAQALETQSAFMAAAAAAVLLVAVLRARRDGTALLFATLILAFGAWSAARGAVALGWPEAPMVASLALVALGGLAPACASSFTGRGRLPRIGVWLWLAPPLLVAGIFAGEGEHAAVRNAARVWALAGVGVATLMLARYPTARDPARNPDSVRLRYLAIAHAIVLIGAGADLLAWHLGAARVGALLSPLLYLYAGYLNLARVRVADLRQLMGNAVALTFVAGGLAGSFAALWLWVGPQLDLFVFNAFVASFVLLLFLEPGRERIQRAMDRRFVAGRIELERALLPLRERLPHLFTLDELLAELLEAIERIGRLRASAIFLRDDPQVGFQQVGSVGLPPRRRVNLIRNPTLVEALESGEVLLVDDLEKDHPGRKRDDERNQTLLRIMRQLDAQLVLPLRTESRLLGFWTLSDERSSEPFSSSELEVLRKVADETAASIENSKTFERVRVRDRLAGLGEMAAGLAHEIRNPLATIRGALAVIGEPREESSREFHGVILEEIERLDRVVGTFLDYAHPDAAPAPLTDLGEFVRCAVERGIGTAEPELELSFDLQPGVPALANPDQLERVLGNLIENARQALDGKGRIEVTVRRAEADDELPAGAEIVIADDGPGMDEATLERALMPFFTTKESGAGMGLALCDRLVRAQGGTLTLLARPEAGTTAVIRLPAHERADEPEEVEP